MDKNKLLPHQIIEKDINLEYRNVWQLYQAKSKLSPDKDFLFSPGIRNDVFTYKDFENKILIVARYLHGKNLKKGDRLNLILPNSPEFLLFYFAALASGVTVVPINQDLAPREMLYIINDSKSKAVFYDSALDFKIQEIKNEVDSDVKIIILNKIPDFEPLLEKFDNGFRIPDVDLMDEAVIIYTSGTTGNPKGVVLSHLNLLADSKAISEWFQFNAETRTLCILPLFHNNGQVVTLLAPLYKGGSTVVVKGKLSLASFWDIIYKYNVTWTSVMPAILSILLSMDNERKNNTMKGIVCGGQILNRAVQEKFEQRFNVPIFEGYGLTETTSFACFNNYPAEKRKEGSIGMQLPVNEITIIDDDGNELGANEEGEICMKGYNVAYCYLGLPEKNAKAFANGWFHSGDFGYKDEYGYLYFRTRKDFLIIKGGENIYPSELENVLFQNPSVAECAVIGIPDKLLGEEICAFVKLKDDIKTTEKELKEFCVGKIAKFKQAKKVIIIDELDDLHEIPKGPTKKVLYRKLKEYYLNKYQE